MIKKEDILKRYKTYSLSSIKDDEIIRLADDGELGMTSMRSASRRWAFKNEHELAANIRKAIELGKELHVAIEEGEHQSEDKVIVTFV